MSAATAARWARFDTIRYKQFPLQTGVSAYQGTMAAADIVNGWVTPAAPGNANLINIGQFDETVLVAAAGQLINVCLDREIKVSWYANATGSNAVTTIFTNCYMLDNQTVQATASSNAVAGRVWALSTTKGVAVEATSL
jgi:hypothetical protein